MDTKALEEVVAPVVEGLGYRLVDLTAAGVRGTLHVSIVIYRPDGVGLNDCETVHRAVGPRMEVLLDNRDLHIEVASPGIDRKFKSDREFAVFVGRGVSVLTDESDWFGGILSSVTDDEIVVAGAEEERTIPLSRVRKAKLDYSQEVR